ncbi:MAG: AmmeMemoRadiSam system protein A [Proteobacteria bacterium]|nr:AmmeMemoRadiSam system protein A [Desulfocapsa sp.]MBU3946339.1 AmmeMemoRadiSam system protein A [Pseudomonadota bacterium]MCG2742746.1 AmmeMemoRadiSam system protein A [Desulfobacteraceae bacterium]MBU3982290.1 AmmeMemoRadiSam system protein A [Pseudomonadota bacterium]MBU4030218.1 AmmeMemoRadiSam system protein A [Pseudomonadota bacterium]
MQDHITEDQGRFLLRLARETIAEKLGKQLGKRRDVVDPALQVECGTFVTLKIGGQLRGCIGNLEPVGSIYESIRRNALNAAFHDSRFPELTVEELAKVHIDISILTRPQALTYRDGADLIARLRPGIDGVILRLGRYSATFLPQVWEQLPLAEEFLAHLCRKAGLSEMAWHALHPEVETYQVQCFEEGKRDERG